MTATRLSCMRQSQAPSNQQEEALSLPASASSCCLRLRLGSCRHLPPPWQPPCACLAAACCFAFAFAAKSAIDGVPGRTSDLPVVPLVPGTSRRWLLLCLEILRGSLGSATGAAVPRSDPIRIAQLRMEINAFAFCVLVFHGSKSFQQKLLALSTQACRSKSAMTRSWQRRRHWSCSSMYEQCARRQCLAARHDREDDAR